MSVEMEIRPLLTDSECIDLGNLISEVKNTHLKQVEGIKNYINYFEDPEELKKRKNWNYENCRNNLFTMIQNLRNSKSNLLRNKRYSINCKQIPFLEDLIVQGRDTIRELEDDNKRMLKQILRNTEVVEGLEATISEREVGIQELKIMEKEI